jgi:hypothetical protein
MNSPILDFLPLQKNDLKKIKTYGEKSKPLILPGSSTLRFFVECFRVLILA